MPDYASPRNIGVLPFIEAQVKNESLKDRLRRVDLNLNNFHDLVISEGNA